MNIWLIRFALFLELIGFAVFLIPFVYDLSSYPRLSLSIQILAPTFVFLVVGYIFNRLDLENGGQFNLKLQLEINRITRFIKRQVTSRFWLCREILIGGSIIES